MHTSTALQLLWDLDGTLTDPREGITRSIVYALEQLGLESPQPNELLWCIGPSLLESFSRLLPSGMAHDPHLALAHYRERYATIGLFENTPYAGVSECLARFTEAGHRHFVATAKPTDYAIPILDRFNLSRHFDRIHGAELDGTRSDKADLIAHILELHGLAARDTIMIGDRSHDIVAARKNGVQSIGVTYGFGSRDELEAAGAGALATTPEEIAAAIRTLLG